ncbi:PTS lactose/cellobiose transporter subunit IIA [Clostridium algidicarnis]|uniref:PTS lactose/cellobiose transporter subunit IIA n=1 Tax=Clostridium algidicarnis TaxID=37659 RepID=A0ABS6C3E3_9CLOT|nr:PTS lactose/cellobiose transporter subunit IIA [Clostridium algidicarnis]MBU3220005.1 PTS lactose/cellobiose transporter subunit IIA [Clostridium algidicarnis]
MTKKIDEVMNEDENVDVDVDEKIIFSLISFSGDAKSCLFEAFNNIKEGNYDLANNIMEEAEKSLMKAHEIQTKLIQKEAEGDHIKVNILMAHAQDHLMNTLLARDLVKNMIEMQKEINNLKEKIK